MDNTIKVHLQGMGWENLILSYLIRIHLQEFNKQQSNLHFT